MTVLKQTFLWALAAFAFSGSLAPTDSRAQAESFGGSTQDCEDVQYRLETGVVYAETFGLDATNVTCETAQTVALEYLSSSEGSERTPTPQGFRCRAAITWSGIVCRRGRNGTEAIRWAFSIEAARSDQDCGELRQHGRLLEIGAVDMDCTKARRYLRSGLNAKGRVRANKAWKIVAAGCEGTLMRARDWAWQRKNGSGYRPGAPRASYWLAEGCRS